MKILIKDIFIDGNREINYIKVYFIIALVDKEFVGSIKIEVTITTMIIATRPIITTKVPQEIYIYFIVILSIFDISSDSTPNFKLYLK